MIRLSLRSGATIGLGPSRPPDAIDGIADLQFLRAASCALAFSSGGSFKLWKFVAATHEFVGSFYRAASGDSPQSYESTMAACEREVATSDGSRTPLLALVVFSDGLFRLHVGAARSPEDVVSVLEQRRDPLPQPDGTDSPLKKLSICFASRSSPDKLKLIVFALYEEDTSRRPMLYRCTYRCTQPWSEGATQEAIWERVALASDHELALAVEDRVQGVPGEHPESEPLCSLTEFYVGQLLQPFRFAPRHLEAATNKHLTSPLPDLSPEDTSTTSNLRSIDAQQFRKDVDAQVVVAQVDNDFEAAAADLGMGLLYASTERRAEAAEILGLSHINDHDDGGSPLTLLVTRSSLTLLQPFGPPVDVVASALHEAVDTISSRCMACVGLSEEKWGRKLSSTPPWRAAEQLLHDATSTGARDFGDDAAADSDAAKTMWEMLSESSETPEGASVQAKIQHYLLTARWDPSRWAGEASTLVKRQAGEASAGALLKHARQLAEALLGTANPEWEKELLNVRQGWLDNHGRGEQHKGVTAPISVDRLCAAISAAARRGGIMCRGLMLLLLLGLERRPSSGLELAEELECRRVPDGLLHLASSLAQVFELLRWLSLHASSALPATNGSALQQLLRLVPVPKRDTLDATPCTSTIIRFVHADVRLAQGVAKTGDRGDHSCSMAIMLWSAKLWRPLRAYLRRLNSAAPLHNLLLASALLQERRFESAAERFRRVVRATATAQIAEIADLREAIRFEKGNGERGESGGDEEHERQWELYRLLKYIWHAFRDCGRNELLLPFAEAALRLPVLKKRDPEQCAALYSLVFDTALKLGRTRQAHSALLGLHAHAIVGAEGDGLTLEKELPFAERRKDCLRALVSVLHERSCLHQLALLPFVGELHAELQEALKWHVRSADVSSSLSAPNAYEVAFALRVRDKDYLGAANTMFQLAIELEHERFRKSGSQQGVSSQQPEDERRLLSRLANAYGACLASLEMLPPAGRFLVEAGPSRADQLRAALDACETTGEIVRGEARDQTSSMLFYVDSFDAQGSPVCRDQTMDKVVSRLREELEKTPEQATKLPVQVYQIRQRRALALARAAVLGAGGSNVGNDRMVLAQGVSPEESLEEVQVLHALLDAHEFDEATSLALSFSREFAKYEIECGKPCGLSLVAARLAKHCVECAQAETAEREWERLKLLLQRHDCEANNFALSAAAAKHALRTDPTQQLPRWLLDSFGAEPPKEGEQRVLRITAAAGGEAGVAGVRRSIGESCKRYPAARASLTVRGSLTCGGDAVLTIPPLKGEAERVQARKLEEELRLKDPGCRPLRRNPAALCRALLESAENVQLKEALRQVEKGCKAACEETKHWRRASPGKRMDDKQKRTRWVTCGLVDQLHAAVARHQVTPSQPSATTPLLTAPR